MIHAAVIRGDTSKLVITRGNTSAAIGLSTMPMNDQRQRRTATTFHRSGADTTAFPFLLRISNVLVGYDAGRYTLEYDDAP